MQCDIVSAEESIFSGEVDLLVADGELGELGITPGHAPLLTPLKPGTVELRQPGSDEPLVYYVSGGFLEVQAGSVTILADTALRSADIDEAAAEAARRAAEQEMSQRSAEMDYAKAAHRIAEAAAQLRTLRRLRNRAERS